MRKTIYPVIALSLLLLSTGSIFAQAAPSPANTDNQQSAATQPSTATATETLSDAQISGILLLANKGEIKAAELARKRAQSKEIKNFAHEMIRDHKAALKELKSIDSKLHMKAANSDVKAELQASAKAGDMRIKDLHGLDFDKAYIDEQVSMHQFVLDTLDNKLLPNAKAPDIKALLDKVRPVIAKHLDHARSLQNAQTAGR